MTRFKDLFHNQSHNKKLEDPSVSVTSKDSGHELQFRFDSKDTVVEAAYVGSPNPWLSSLCEISKGKNLNALGKLNLNDWDVHFKDDQSYWDHKEEILEDFICKPLELLHAALDVFRGREYLYQEASPLICRCFGVRESDVVAHLKSSKEVSLDSLGGITKAGRGCRSCVPQLKRWLMIHETKKVGRFYKDKSHADWLLDIDYMVTCIPEAADWKMNVESFKNEQVIISYSKKVSQKEVEEMGKRVQEFLKASVDEGLDFYLRSL